MKTSRILLGWVIIVSFFSLFPAPARAQYRAGLQGVVLDAQGAAVEGATVTLNNVDTNREQETTSTAGGVYTFLSLPPGNYTVTVEKTGFKKNVLENVSIAGEQIQALNITLELGVVTSSVTVNARNPPQLSPILRARPLSTPSPCPRCFRRRRPQ